MKYIYILLTLLVLFILVFLVTEDRCTIERFTQFPQNKFVCKDPNASNYYSGETSEDQIENNSYCSYNTSVVCNRPFADNYDPSANFEVNTLPNMRNLPYNWGKPMLYEHYWHDTFHSSSYSYDFFTLNVTKMSLLRGDAHPGKDCLHFCPGTVPKNWARMLVTLLNRIQ